MQKLRITASLGILGLLVMAVAGCHQTHYAKAPYSYEFEYGESTMLRGSRAVAPKKAPQAVHRAVAAGNRIQGKPYRLGGGHRQVEDSCYDCSGTVSYALIHAGVLRSPLTSDGFKNYGEPGPGKWITIYAKSGHTFVSIGGLRLDTGFRRDGGKGPKWLTGSRPAKGYVLRHPPGL